MTTQVDLVLNGEKKRVRICEAIVPNMVCHCCYSCRSNAFVNLKTFAANDCTKKKTKIHRK
jgi:hypothetical protein